MGTGMWDFCVYGNIFRMKPKLSIVTGNELKFRELTAFLSDFFDCEQKVLENYREIQGKSEEIILHKLKAAHEAFGGNVLVDDTALHFDELNGFPGPYIKDFISLMPIYEMGMKFAGTRAKVACHLGLSDGKSEPVLAVGTVGGFVIKPEKINPGIYEFDLYFQIDGTDKPMIDLSIEEKNKFSHRGLALRDLTNKLQYKYGN